MKILLSLSLLVSLGLFSTATLADRRSNRDDDTHGYSNRGNSSQHWDNRDRRPTTYRRERDTDVSVNVIIGAGRQYNPGYNSIFNTFGYGVGYSSFGGQYFLNQGYPYSPWSYRNNRPVVIEHNTYIEQPVERSGVTTYRNRPSGTNLLRDLQGHCFERVIDRNGNELRTELDPSECDF